MKSEDVLCELTTYLSIFPDEGPRLRPVFDLLRDAFSDPFDRRSMRGHITASLFILNEDRNAAALIHHKTLDKWLQPGGHIESGDKTIVDAALREAAEETGLRNITLLPVHGLAGIPLDIDVHPIPARSEKGEGDHYHHDFVYLGVASSATPVLAQLEEVHAVEWPPLQEILAFDNPRMQTLAHKAMALF